MAEAAEPTAAPIAETKSVDKSAAAPAKTRLPLRESDFRLREEKQNHWTCFVPSDITMDELAVKSFWSHVSSKVRETDIVHVIAHGGEWIADFYCAAAYAQGLDLRLLPGYPLKIERSSDAESVYAQYKLEYLGPVQKWTVTLKEGNRMLKSGMRTEGEAQAFLNDHVRAVKKVA